MGQDPGLTLTLGSVPVNLTLATQAYEMFAGQGTIHPATTIREIRDRNGRVIYSLDDNGPKPLKPVTPAEAYLTHWILESNTDPSRNIYWGPTAELTDQLYALSSINRVKFAALDKLYFGLTVMTVMLAILIGTIGLSHVIG